jgi:hypothetical protein
MGLLTETYGPWRAGFQCRNCGHVFSGSWSGDCALDKDHGPCHVCGEAYGNDQVSVRRVSLRTRSWMESKVPGGYQVTAYHDRLASLLDIESDGGDSPGAYVMHAIAEASQ